jgi:hypothetical protein
MIKIKYTSVPATYRRIDIFGYLARLQSFDPSVVVSGGTAYQTMNLGCAAKLVFSLITHDL